MVGEREFLASLVEFKHHSMAETIQNEKEEKKTKAEAPGLTKKDNLLNYCVGNADFLTVCRSGLDLIPVQLRRGSGYEDN